MQKHIRILTEIFDELAVIGSPVEEEDTVVHLQPSLPESYSILVITLEASSEASSELSRKRTGKLLAPRLYLSHTQRKGW